MVDADDYESLPESAPFWIVASAGAAAGVAEHCTMYPVDSVKVCLWIMKLQHEKAQYS